MVLTETKQNELQNILNEMFKGCNNKQVEECKVKVTEFLKTKFKMRQALIDKFISTAIDFNK